MKPRVSVISIFYNAAEFLGEAIESVLAQDFTAFEVLMVDDGSTDRSAAIARSYCEDGTDKVRYLRHGAGANLGMSASRNLGISEARGEYIAFIDADDRWGRSKLREQLAILDRHPEVDGVCGSVNYWESWTGGKDEVVPTGDDGGNIVAPPDAAVRWYPLGKAHAPSMSDLLMRAEAVRAVDGFERNFTGAYEDQAFLAKFYLQSSIFVSTEVWSDYRLHDGSCMAKTVREGRYNAVRRDFLDWYSRYLEQNPAVQFPSVVAALNRARSRERHSTLTKPFQVASRALRKFGSR
jgi:glycosyltransferase involved in cell wall biosynthesis